MQKVLTGKEEEAFPPPRMLYTLWAQPPKVSHVTLLILWSRGQERERERETHTQESEVEIDPILFSSIYVLNAKYLLLCCQQNCIFLCGNTDQRSAFTVDQDFRSSLQFQLKKKKNSLTYLFHCMRKSD